MLTHTSRTLTFEISLWFASKTLAKPTSTTRLPSQSSIAKANRFRRLCLCDLSPPNRSKPKQPQRGLDIFFATSASTSMLLLFHRLMLPINTPSSSPPRSSVLPANVQYMPITNTTFILATSSSAALPQKHHMRRKAGQTKQLKRVMQAQSRRTHFTPVAAQAHHPRKICCAKARYSQVHVMSCPSTTLKCQQLRAASQFLHSFIPERLHRETRVSICRHIRCSSRRCTAVKSQTTLTKDPPSSTTPSRTLPSATQIAPYRFKTPSLTLTLTGCQNSPFMHHVRKIHVPPLILDTTTTAASTLCTGVINRPNLIAEAINNAALESAFKRRSLLALGHDKNTRSAFRKAQANNTRAKCASCHGILLCFPNRP